MSVQAFAYLGSFDCADTNNGFSTIQVATSGKTTISVNIGAFSSTTSDGTSTTTVYNHYGVGLGDFLSEDRRSSNGMARSYSTLGFGPKTQASLQAAATAAGWASTAANLTCSFNAIQCKFTFGYSATMTVTFGSAATYELFGYSGNTLSGASSYVSTNTPDFCIVPTLTATSSSTPNYEPESVSSQAVSNAGTTFGLDRSAVPLYRDWTQQFETKEKTLRRSALAAHPFTFQELVECSRASLPFVVMNGFGDGIDEAFFFRVEGSQWKCERASDGNDAQFHIPFKTVLQGYSAVSG